MKKKFGRNFFRNPSTWIQIHVWIISVFQVSKRNLSVFQASESESPTSLLQLFEKLQLFLKEIVKHIKKNSAWTAWKDT